MASERENSKPSFQEREGEPFSCLSLLLLLLDLARERESLFQGVLECSEEGEFMPRETAPGLLSEGRGADVHRDVSGRLAGLDLGSAAKERRRRGRSSLAIQWTAGLIVKITKA